MQVGINGGMIWAFKTRLNKMLQDILHGWALSDRQMHSGTQRVLYGSDLYGSVKVPKGCFTHKLSLF